MPTSDASRSARRWRADALAVAAYAALSAYFCWELLAAPLSRLPFYAGDGWLTYWNYWWARFSLLELGAWPLQTNYLSYPHVTSLIFQAHDLLHGLLTIPLQLAVPGPPGVALAVNVVTTSCYFFSAVAAYAWLRFFVGSPPAAFVAGFGYAFAAFHVSWTPMPVVAALYWLPLFALLFVRAVRREGFLTALWPGVCFALCTFQSLYYTLFLALLALFLFAYAAFAESPWTRVRGRLLRIAVGLTLGALPMGALVIADLARSPYVAAASRQDTAKNIDHDCRNSVDLAGLVIPAPTQGLWGKRARPWNDYLHRPTCKSPLFGLNGVGGQVVYVGIIPLLLALLAWFAAPPRVAAAWTIGTLGFLAVALGPYLHLHGDIYRDWWLPLPYRLLLALPPRLANMYHAPSYFFVLALFGIWTLAAFGMARLFAIRGRKTRRLWIALLFGWLALDYTSRPLPSWPIETAPLYERIRAETEPMTVLELPTDDYLLLEWYNGNQVVHQRPLARGFLSRVTASTRSRDDGIAQALLYDQALDLLLCEIGPSYVIAHPTSMTKPRYERLLTTLRTRFGAALVFEDAMSVAFRIVPECRPGQPLRLRE